ncbi:MAG: MFS transporter [Chloroflexi bacterium]|nr:MFS transporter [Chloroflexota bacterium]
MVLSPWALVINSLNTVCLSLGVTVSVVSAGPLTQLGDWKLPLTVFGALGVLGGVVWLWAGRDSSAVGAAPSPISLRRVVSVVRTRPVLLLVAADAGILVQSAGPTSWLSSFYNEQRGLSLAEAGFVTGVLSFVGIFTVLMGGALPLRVGSARLERSSWPLGCVPGSAGWGPS